MWETIHFNRNKISFFVCAIKTNFDHEIETVSKKKKMLTLRRMNRFDYVLDKNYLVIVFLF